MVGSTQSKRWRIELLYRYKKAKTSGITMLNIRKLYLYFVYFKPYVYFEWSPRVFLKNDARATLGKPSIALSNGRKLCTSIVGDITN